MGVRVGMIFKGKICFGAKNALNVTVGCRVGGGTVGSNDGASVGASEGGSLSRLPKPPF